MRSMYVIIAADLILIITLGRHCSETKSFGIVRSIPLGVIGEYLGAKHSFRHFPNLDRRRRVDFASAPQPPASRLVLAKLDLLDLPGSPPRLLRGAAGRAGPLGSAGPVTLHPPPGPLVRLAVVGWPTTRLVPAARRTSFQ